MSPDTIVPGTGPLTVTPNDAVATTAWATPGGGPGNPQELNRYSYALNNPARYTDPTGHCADPITLTLCVVAVGAVLVSGSLVAVNASNTAAQTASGASAAPVAEQILDDLTPFWLDVAMTAGPPLAETILHATADGETASDGDELDQLGDLPGNVDVKDLRPLHSPEVTGARPELEGLSDDQLLDSVTRPRNNDPVTINPQTGNIVDGNGRARELQRRAADPSSSIRPDTKIPVKYRFPPKLQ